MSLPAMSFGDRFCFSREGRIGVGTGRAISVQFGVYGVRNKQSRLVEPSFPAFKARFSAKAGWHFPRDLTRQLLIRRCDQSHVSVKDG